MSLNEVNCPIVSVLENLTLYDKMEIEMKSLMSFILTLTVALLFCASEDGLGQSTSDSDIPRGIIKGSVVDKETKSPLSDANVVVVGTKKGRKGCMG